MSTFAKSDPASWASMVDLNVYGVLHCTRAVLAEMQAGGWGRVVTISSDSARTGESRIAVYAATKAFGPALMRSVAREVGQHGVTCNSLSLGTVPPAGGDRLPEDVAKQARRYATRRLGTPQDIAAAVLWLSSDEAAWVTGQTIPVNGGYAAS
jgi:3-oxoacyl-[acyl-carrier protein] reductase